MNKKRPIIELPFVQALRERLKAPQMLMQFILGPRQVGKTTGVQQLLKDYAGPCHYLLAEDELVSNREWLKKAWWQAQSLGPKALLVVDEIQKVERWSDTLKFLWDETQRGGGGLRCIFLGSSSLNISQGLQESLAGRYESLVVPHWDFETSKALCSLSFADYLKYGGYPGSYQFLSDPVRWQQYLKGSIVENVLTKDIFRLAIVKKPALFRQLVELAAAYPAQEVSYSKLLGQIQESGNVEVVKYYLHLLQESYLFFSLQKYSAKKVLQKASSPKLIALCPALTQALAPEVSQGRRLENYVGAKLLRLPGKTYYWKDRQYEVDFIFKSMAGKIFAIEVKSGRKKNSKSLSFFLAKHRDVTPLVIDQDNIHRLEELLMDAPS